MIATQLVAASVIERLFFSRRVLALPTRPVSLQPLKAAPLE
jgi:hypothetical protein